MKILTLGDSNASNLFGDSWPIHLKNKISCEIKNYASPGAGHGMYIEKLHLGIKNFNPDYVIIQLTEAHRLTLGDTENEIEGELDNKCFNNVGYYTWNVWDNESHIKQNTGKKVSVDHYMIPNVLLSRWINYNFCQDILKMHYICNHFNVPCIFFSWFDPLEETILKDYDWLLDKLTYIKGSAKDWLESNNISKAEDHVHYDSIAQKHFVKNWLIPNLDELKILTNK